MRSGTVCGHAAGPGIMVAMTVTTPPSPTRIVRPFDIPKKPPAPSVR
jgi:hypothetical protein